DASHDGRYLVFAGAGTSTLDGTHDINGLEVLQGATLAHPFTDGITEHRLELVVRDEVSLDISSAIDASGRGYLANRTLANTTSGAATGQSGASYGGRGG